MFKKNFVYCFSCHKKLAVETQRVGRGEACPSCKADIHVCKNCQFYDVSAYNECREPQAERVLEKEKSNFCDYFVFSTRTDDATVSKPETETKKKLEDLFKK